MFQITVTQPAPVRLEDRCEGVPANILTTVIRESTYTLAIERFSDWLADADWRNEVSFADWMRVENILMAVSCDTVFQAGKYSIDIRTQ